MAKLLVGERRSCSMRMTEVIVDTGQAAWTQVDAGCTVATSGTRKIGSLSASFALAAAAAQGIQARIVPATDNTDISTSTHLKLWIRTTVALTAGQLRIGFDNTAAAAGTQYYTSLPAVPVINTWYRVCVPLTNLMTAANLLTLSSVSTLILYLQDTAFAGTVLIDDVRVSRYVGSGAAAITFPSVCTRSNTDADGINTDVWQLPFKARRITVHKLPQSTDFTYLLGAPGTWAAADVVMGMDPLDLGMVATDLERDATAIAFVLGTNLASGEYISIAGVE